MMVCPICQSVSKRLFQKDGYWILGCTKCHYEFLEERVERSHVDIVYGDDYFVGGGAGYPDYIASGGLVRAHGRRYGRIVSRFLEVGRVLDVGAAAGFFLSGLQDCGWKGDGTEPNEKMASFARDQLGVNVQCGTLESLPDGIRQQRYDLVTMIQVVPHFYDIHEAFRQAVGVTKENGYWLIETWDRESLSAKWFGQHWHEYSPPSVLRWFSRRNLEELCRQYGFQRVATGRPQKWISGAHAKSLMRYKLENFPLRRISSSLLNLVPDRLNIPYPSEDLFWILLKRTDGGEG
jgi:2-polyprenyl-3-methyl-5-hydroxy-6-metoxy-1,4-benzoquinol methylase